MAVESSARGCVPSVQGRGGGGAEQAPGRKEGRTRATPGSEVVCVCVFVCAIAVGGASTRASAPASLRTAASVVRSLCVALLLAPHRPGCYDSIGSSRCAHRLLVSQLSRRGVQRCCQCTIKWGRPQAVCVCGVLWLVVPGLGGGSGFGALVQYASVVSLGRLACWSGRD